MCIYSYLSYKQLSVIQQWNVSDHGFSSEFKITLKLHAIRADLLNSRKHLFCNKALVYSGLYPHYMRYLGQFVYCPGCIVMFDRPKNSMLGPLPGVNQSRKYLGTFLCHRISFCPFSSSPFLARKDSIFSAFWRWQRVEELHYKARKVTWDSYYGALNNK